MLCYKKLLILNNNNFNKNRSMKTIPLILILFLSFCFSGLTQTYIGFSYTTPPMPIVSAGNDTMVQSGVPFTLQGNVTSGTSPFNYDWQPAAYLNDNTLLNPVATITNDVTFTLTVTDSAGCEASDQVEITIDPIGISEVSSSPFTIYPNPSDGSFYVQGFDQSKTEVSVLCYSVYGSLLISRSYTVEGSTLKLDLDKVAPGIYFLKFITGSNQYYQRIVIQ